MLAIGLITAHIALCIFWMLDLYYKYHGLRRWSKGLLMPCISLIYILFCIRQNHTLDFFLLAGLGAGWLGDLFLLKEDDPHFVIGLISFLLGHVFYSIHFLHAIRPYHVHPLIFSALALYVLYACIVMHALWPKMEKKLYLSCLVYLCVIAFMSFSALCALSVHPVFAYALSFAGSLIFVLSDTLVAWERFGNPHIHGVMETYVPAQYLIMLGILLG
ncbi:MAG: lysoplasmalogenase [Lactimicrobium sp.]|jgi:uncharacterized membrane protein YhhN|uniref:lysoplasmalogenase n=1 Tax=Lactimicrobium sp. TaxID=2563780 RepID=UPI002F353E18